MIFSKILYDNEDAAEAMFAGNSEYFEVELKAILESMSKDEILRPILFKALNDIADKLEEELGNEQK